MNRQPSKTTYIDSYLRKGTLMFWNEKIYIIDSCDLSQFTIDVIENETGNPSKLDYFEVMHDQKRDKEPVFANSITELFQKMREMEQNTKHSRVLSEKGISESLIRKAQNVIDVVEAVDLALKVAIERARQENKQINLTPVIKDCLASLSKPVSLTTYYAYLARYDANNGVRARVALSYTTIRYHQTQKSPTLLHLVDLLLERLYFNKKGIPWRPSRIFTRLQNILSHTGGLWIDPKKCGGLIRDDLISELLQTDRSFDFVARNPEKMALMSPAGSVSASWFYQRFAYLRQLYDQPDDYSRTAFLRLGHRTQLPHDQAYMDEWQLSIYREHKGVREKLLDLWITWVLEV